MTSKNMFVEKQKESDILLHLHVQLADSWMLTDDTETSGSQIKDGLLVMAIALSNMRVSVFLPVLEPQVPKNNPKRAM